MFKTTREKLKINQHEMGQKLGVSQDMISAMEKGKRYPSFKTILNFYTEFGINNLENELIEEISRKEEEKERGNIEIS